MKLTKNNFLDATHFEVATPQGNVILSVVHSSRAKRISLKSRPREGDIALILPKGRTLKEGKAFAQSRADWIGEVSAKLDQAPTLNSGSIIPIRGVEHLLLSKEELRGKIEALHLPGDEYPILKVPGGMAHFQRRLVDWFRKEALKDISQAVDYYAPLAGVNISGITIRDTRSRWGSCSSTGKLNFSWRLILAPPFVLQYLAAHEVAHRIEMNHSAKYWAIVKKIEPEYMQAERWLKQHGSSLQQIRV